MVGWEGCVCEGSVEEECVMDLVGVDMAHADK